MLPYRRVGVHAGARAGGPAGPGGGCGGSRDDRRRGPRRRRTQANAAPGPNTLLLAPGCTYNLTAPDNPGKGLPVITSDIAIAGSLLGTRNVSRRQGATDFRIFEVTGPNARLTLTNSRLTENGGRWQGGGLYASDLTGTVTDTLVPSNCTPSVIAGCAN
ncbi:hypothetical protein ACFYYS_32380 [Streptomyces sp. NPDC002120]|uniref:hypothetical protein n=1 Tax=Streptomyces sp. NPDC002120 TaxID=3364631 RepID=UPI0036C4FD3B